MHKVRFGSLWIILWLAGFLLPPGPARGQAGLADPWRGLGEVLAARDHAADEEIFSGFDDDPAPGQAHLDSSSARQGQPLTAWWPAWLELSGSMGLSASYNFAHEPPAPGEPDQRDFSRLRTALDVNADFTLPQNWRARIGGKAFYDAIHALRGRGQYTAEVLDQYEDELEFTELYLQGSLLPALDLKIGRQVVVWGKSDNIRVTDLLNPLDNREPGVVDIKDLRLPVAMTKLDYYTGDWNLSGIMVHEFRANKEPVIGNDFFTGSSASPLEEKPGLAWDNQEYGLALNGIFSGWDVSFYGAWFWNDQSHQEDTLAGIRRRYNHNAMLGTSMNIVRGNWLLKGEAAYVDGLEYSIAVGKKQRLDLLIGAEYNGFSETVVSFELANRHLFSFDERLKQSPVHGQRDELQSVLRINRDLFNDTLQLSLLLSTFDLTGEDGSFQRVSAKYDWSDSINITAGLICYQSGNNAMFQKIGDNDRLFTEIRYTF